MGETRIEGKEKNLLMEVENMIGEIDDEVLKQMLGRYIEEKGLSTQRRLMLKTLTKGRNESE